MSEESKIPTKPTSMRLPEDVLEALQRWADETKQSIAGCITNLVRVALEDEKRITSAAPAPENVLHEEELGVGVIQLRKPKTRDELADAFTVLIHETNLIDRDQISALGVARARIYKGTPEYAMRQKLVLAGKVSESPYENEKALAEELSKRKAVILERPKLD